MALHARYHQAIKECPVNHSKVDDERFWFDKRFAPELRTPQHSGFGAWLRGRWSVAKYWIVALWLPIASCAAVASIIAWRAMTGS